MLYNEINSGAELVALHQVFMARYFSLFKGEGQLTTVGLLIPQPKDFMIKCML